MYALHFISTQGEIEDVEALAHVFGVARTRDRCDDVLLDQPAQCDLRDGAALGFGDLAEHRIVENAATRQRAVGHEDQAFAAAMGEHFGLIEVGVVFGLQHRELLRTQAHRLVEQRDVEIGDSDKAGLAFAPRLGQRVHGFCERDVINGRPVHQQQIDIIGLQAAKTLFNRAREIGSAQIFVRHLGGEKNILASDA